MMKRLLPLILVLLMMLSVAIPVGAAETATGPPYITKTYSPDILRTASGTRQSMIFTDATTGMPSYCLDYDRTPPSPNSLDTTNAFDPATIFDPATFTGLKSLLLAGYPYSTGNGLSDAEAQGCTQFAVWCWTYETMGYGLDPANYSAIPGKEHIYEYFISLMEAARNQSLPDQRLSAPDISMQRAGDVLTGQTIVEVQGLNGGYTLDMSMLPEGMTVSGYTGNDGDVLTFTAPLSFAGQRLSLQDILHGHDERSALNLLWYDNTDPSMQRMSISTLDMNALALTGDIALDCQGAGSLRLLKKSSEENVFLAGATYALYDSDTGELLCELTTDEHGEASIELAAGSYHLLEQVAPTGYELSPDVTAFSLEHYEEKTVIVKDRPIRPVGERPSVPSGKGPSRTMPKTGDASRGGLSALALLFGSSLIALCLRTVRKRSA